MCNVKNARMDKIKLIWNKFCIIFENMSWKVKKSPIYKVVFGNTRTKQVSGVSKIIVNNRELSKQLYAKIDGSDDFTVESKDGKKYKVRQLVPSK